MKSKHGGKCRRVGGSVCFEDRGDAKRSCIALVLTFLLCVSGFLIAPIERAEALEGDIPEWKYPANSTVSNTPVLGTGISFANVSEDGTKVYLDMAYRAAATSSSLDWIYLRMNPSLDSYIQKIEVQNTANVGAKIGYLRYMDRVLPSSLGNLNSNGSESGLPDAYANEGHVWRAVLDRAYLTIPGSNPTVRSFFSGNWGVFPNDPLEADRYEGLVTVYLEKPISEIVEETGVDGFPVDLRLQGQSCLLYTSPSPRDA